MFGHLKAEDFTNLIEGHAISPRRSRHLETCGRCRQQWKAVETVHRSVSALETNGDEPLEPDWTEFRDGVRDRMLSRSAVRNMAVQRWTPWKLVPAGAMVAALGVGLLLHQYMDSRVTPVQPGDGDNGAISLDRDSLVDAKDVWVRASAFEDMVTLGPEESERFRELLELETSRSAQETDPQQ